MFEKIFEFEVKSLGYSQIENAICRHFEFGMPNSSHFMEIVESNSQRITIIADKGSVTCSVSAYRKKDSELYVISCSSITVKRKKR